MTITTAKLSGKALRLTPLALAALLMSAECRADWKFTPTLGFTETYSDNPGLQSDAQAHGQWISESVPAFTLISRSRRLRLAASGEWHFYAYQDKNTPNMHDRERRYAANAEARLIEDFLDLDASANGSRQATSAFGPRYTELYSGFNSTDIRTWSISPVVRHRFGSAADLQLRFTRDGVQADGASAAFGDSLSSTALFNLSSAANGANRSAFGWGLQYMRQNMDTERFGQSTTVNAAVNLSYRLSRTWSLVANAGHDSYEYPALNDRTAGNTYTGGFVWTPSSRTSVDARFGHSYLGKTGSLAATQSNRRLVSRVSYTDQVTTSRQQFLMPASFDTASMLDKLFASAISDPLARAQAVQTYMATTGLPSSLASSVNYLSNRFVREKRLQAAYIYSMPHSALALSAYKSERTPIMREQSESDVLGSQLGMLDDNVRQRGIDAQFSYRLSPRTNTNAGLSASRSTSMTTGAVSPSHVLRLGLTHQFDRRTHGSVELRHVTSGYGIPGFGPGGYTENALSATLSVQL